MILRAEGISKSYQSGNRRLEVLNDVNLSLSEGEIVSVMGPSGSGKSTLLNILGTLDRPDMGNLWIDDENVLQLDDESLSVLRNKTIGFIFQFHHLLPEFSVIENLMIPQLMNGVSKENAAKHALGLLEMVSLDERKDHKPSALSGGERQRTAVLRALVNNPRVVLADEPTGNLDMATGERVMKLIRQMRDELGVAFLIVTHNAGIASSSDYELEIRDKKLVERGQK